MSNGWVAFIALAAFCAGGLCGVIACAWSMAIDGYRLHFCQCQCTACRDVLAAGPSKAPEEASKELK